MKILAVLFSAYLLVLSVVPCADRASTFQDKTTEIALSHEHDHPDYPSDDFCTPFCICSCCSTTMTFDAGEIGLKIVQRLKTEKIIPFATSFYLSDFYGNTWRPPIFC